MDFTDDSHSILRIIHVGHSVADAEAACHGRDRTRGHPVEADGSSVLTWGDLL
jgi:hypothetical protein